MPPRALPGQAKALRDSIVKQKNSAWKSPWVIAWVLLVVVVLAVNFVMIYLSIEANPGLVVEDYYERGQDYEDNLAKRLARDPGWRMQVRPPEHVGVNAPARFRFSVFDRTGQPVRPDRVEFFAYRPSDAKRDFSAPMTEIEPGLYEVDVSFPLQGLWDILVSASLGDSEYHASHRLSAGVASSP